MRARVNRERIVRTPHALCALWVLFVSLASSSSAFATASSESQEYAQEARRWAISAALSSGITRQVHFGRIDTPVQIGTAPTGSTVELPVSNPGPNPPYFSRPPSSGSFLAISPYVAAGIELMSPAFEALPGRPRLYASAEILPSFAPVGTIALEGSATGLLTPNLQPQNFPASLISGPGSRLTARLMTTVIGARIGAAFPFEWRGHRLRLRPSLGWIRYGVLVEGKVIAAYKDDPIPPPQGCPVIACFGFHTRAVDLNGRGASFFNALGPGLELELELGRFGSVRPALFLEAHAYRTLGNRTISFSDRQSFREADVPPADWDQLGDADYEAHWKFDVDPWLYRAGVGFRVRWVGR